VRKRCDEATPAPWKTFMEDRDFLSGESFIGRGPNRAEEDLYLTGGTVADLDFIAHARQDIPLLLQEIERLNALLQG
jgi:hypothetical protein